MTVDLTGWLWIKFWGVLVHFSFFSPGSLIVTSVERLSCVTQTEYTQTVLILLLGGIQGSPYENWCILGKSSYGSPGWCSANTAVLAVFLRDATRPSTALAHLHRS